MDVGFIVAAVLAIVAIVVVIKTAVVVPQQNAYIIENLGRYSRTLGAGFNILVPFLERVAYRHTLKEQAIDVEEQICITSDNVQVGVDGVLYLQVMDARKASYGIGDYLFAIAQLAQTTLRSEIGKIELDKTFEERSHINLRVVEELDQASTPWGVKVLRYEIKNINPPRDVLTAMEKQMRAEREKRAVVLQSEGDRDAKINEAEGEAAAILAVAEATAEGLKKVAAALNSEGGDKAMQLRVAEDYLERFGNLAREGNTLIVPANLSDVSSMIGAATTVLKKTVESSAASN